MKIASIILGILLTLFGGMWTYLAFAPPNPDGDIGYMIMGPPSLMVGLGMVFIPLLWGAAGGEPNTDKTKDN